MVGTRRLTELAESVTSRLDLPEGSLVVGLSGGADSAALAWLCARAGRTVRAIHINHGLPGSPLMESAARSVAEGLDVDLDVRNVEVPQGPSPEGQARSVRYEEFLAAMDDDAALLTGHTRDDHVETVLFNLIRGTGPRGLAGIPHHRPPNIHRPMLAITRSETREMATLAGLAFVDDPMNEDPDVTRNLIRSRIYPMLSELNPRLPESITRMAAAIGSDNRYLDSVAGEIAIRQEEHQVALAVGDLLASPRPVADRVLKEMLVRSAGGDSVTADRVARLRSVAKGEVESAQIVEDIEARRHGPMLVLDRSAIDHVAATVRLDPGEHRVGSLRYAVTSHDGVCRVIPLSRWSALFAAGTELEARPDGLVYADDEAAWAPGEKRFPVAWYQPGSVGYLSVFATEESGWTSSP